MTLRYKNSKVPHGYIRYTYGCRCEVCKAAKAEYMRNRRRGFRDGTLTATFEHGTRWGYDECMCRCDACLDAKNAADRAYLSRKAVAR